MGRIASAFKRLGKINEIALIPRLIIGYPSLETTRQVVPVMARQGADLIELEIPSPGDQGSGVRDRNLEIDAFGAAMRRAGRTAFEQGVTIADCLSVAAAARRANEIPLLFRSYYAAIRDYGPDKFATDCAASGVDGLALPDLPPEQAGDFKALCELAGLDLIFLPMPNSADGHLERLAQMTTGFAYCILPSEPMGAPSQPGPNIAHLVERVRWFTGLPVVVDFDISTPQQVAQAAIFADGAVVGSPIINLMESLSEEEVILGVADLVRGLKEATLKTPVPPR